MRSQLLEGKLPLPSIGKFITAIGKSHTDVAERMFNAMWHNYLKNKGSISLPYWADKFDNIQVFNMVIMSLSNGGYIVSHSIPARNWAEAHINEDKLLEHLSPNELEQMRAYYKHQRYMLRDEVSDKTTATRLGGKTVDTGLVRNGFMKAGNTKFSYDQSYMAKYGYSIERNLTKSMDKIAEIWPDMKHDRASYDTISIEMLDYYLNYDGTYTRGHNFNDSRGRAISSCLGKIGNPISSKDFRSLIIIPKGV